LIVADANILMELLEQRSKYNKVVEYLNTHVQESTNIATTVLSISTVFYLAEAHKVKMSRVENLIKPFIVLDVISDDLSWALQNYKKRDLEDAIQIASAKRSGASKFITLDNKLSKKYCEQITIDLIK